MNATEQHHMKNLVRFLQNAGLKLKKPKLVMKLELNKIVIALAPNTGRYPGCVHISDGGGFGNNVYYGRINPDGTTVWRLETNDAVKQLVADIATDPVRVAHLQGQKYGHCMFCGTELTTKASLAVGYGPICAEKWGLPWGAEPDLKTLDIGLGLPTTETTPSQKAVPEMHEHHLQKVEDVGIAYNGDRVWVCINGQAWLRAKIIAGKLAVEVNHNIGGK